MTKMFGILALFAPIVLGMGATPSYAAPSPLFQTVYGKWCAGTSRPADDKARQSAEHAVGTANVYARLIYGFTPLSNGDVQVDAYWAYNQYPNAMAPQQGMSHSMNEASVSGTSITFVGSSTKSTNIMRVSAAGTLVFTIINEYGTYTGIMNCR